jgi:hypothetical protein
MLCQSFFFFTNLLKRLNKNLSFDIDLNVIIITYDIIIVDCVLLLVLIQSTSLQGDSVLFFFLFS